MQEEQKVQLSSLMDGEFTENYFIGSVSHDEDLQSCWHRYHVVRDVIRRELHSSSLTLDISNQVAQAIANDDLYGQLPEQPKKDEVLVPDLNTLLWIKVKEVISKVSQVGLAACVTLAVIAGVQYQQGQSNDTTGTPMLNTVPVGVSVAPVGGLSQQNDQQLLEKRQHDKIRLLVQDYELQKRLNAH